MRDRSLDAFCRAASLEDLLGECAALDRFRRENDNLYERVRALFFLYAIYRFHLPLKAGLPAGGLVPFDGYDNLLKRRFEEAIDIFLAAPLGDGTASALAEAYRRLGFQTLADQVRRSVRSVRGNQWMFRIGHPADYPLRVRPELFAARKRGALRRRSGAVPHSPRGHAGAHGPDPQRLERHLLPGHGLPGGRPGAERLHRPRRARAGRRRAGRPPIEAYFRVIDQPVLRLASVDLGATAEITTLAEVFDFAKDYLGLLKAAVSPRASCRRAWRAPASRWPTCWRGWSARATASSWSARSTASPRARGWPSPPTCWPR